MAVEEKAEVTILTISWEETSEMLRCWGYELLESERIFGGYSSSNVRVVVRRPGQDASTVLLLKVCHYSATLEDLEHQVFVVQHLKPFGFPTAYVHCRPDGGAIVQLNGKCALLLDYIGNSTPGQKLLSAHHEDAPFVEHMMCELGASLATLHGIRWPALAQVRDVRTHGFALCNTGDLLKGEVLEELKGNPLVSGHEFLAECSEALPWLRSLYALDLPRSLIHGDAFLDNTLYAETGDLLALIDWEDSASGPCVLDLAVCLSACCFTQENAIDSARFKAIFTGYRSKRRLGRREVSTLVDFMAAGALACGFYRFWEFKVRQPDSAPAAQDSYKIMAERYKTLRTANSCARRSIEATLHACGVRKQRPNAVWCCLCP